MPIRKPPDGTWGAAGVSWFSSRRAFYCARPEESLFLSYVVAQTWEIDIVSTVVRARIDERVKDEAAAVLASIGLTVSDAFRLMLVRVAAEKKLPFEPLVPKEETVEVMRAARRGDIVEVGKLDDLLADLNADD